MSVPQTEHEMVRVDNIHDCKCSSMVYLHPNRPCHLSDIHNNCHGGGAGVCVCVMVKLTQEYTTKSR